MGCCKRQKVTPPEPNRRRTEISAIGGGLSKTPAALPGSNVGYRKKNLPAAGGDLSDGRTATTGGIQPDGNPATGKIGTTGDQNTFRFDLLHNASYHIDGKDREPNDRGGTLADPAGLLIGPRGVRITEALGLITLKTVQYTSEGVVDDNRGEGKNEEDTCWR